MLKLKTDRPTLPFTLIEFDSTSTDVLCCRVPIGEVPNLTDATFVPRHGTPLYEAMTMAINRAKAAYKPDDKIVITVLTDGEENSSGAEFTRQSVSALIKEISAWGWQIVFLGAAFDAYKDGGNLGIGVGKTMSYNAHDRVSSLRASGVVGQSINDFYECGADISFSAEQKASVGDAFVPTQPAADPVKPKALVDDIQV